MKIRIKYNYWFLKFTKINGIVLYPYILISVSEPEAKKKHFLHHELVHINQIKRDGLLKFYIKYLYEWKINLFRYWSFRKAYRNISYEKEAYVKMKTLVLPKRLR